MHVEVFTLRLPRLRQQHQLLKPQLLQQQQRQLCQSYASVLQVQRHPSFVYSSSSCRTPAAAAAAAAALRRWRSGSSSSTMKREDSSSPSPAAAAPTEQQQQQQQKQPLSPEDEKLKAEREARKKAKELEKAAKLARKKAQEQEQRAAAAALLRVSDDVERDSYGYLPLMQSASEALGSKRHFVALPDVHKFQDEPIWVRARLQECRSKGSLVFLLLREGLCRLQVVLGDWVDRAVLRFASSVPLESLVDIYGLVTLPETPVASSTESVELRGLKCFVAVKASKELPFQIRDAMNSADKDEGIQVHLETRLDNRCLDLRVPATLATARAVSVACRALRSYLESRGFVEIHTPKILEGASESGASCFRLAYFDKQACLAQSPQLYKQMCVAGDMQRVYEVGPVFRAENSNTHRHLCEFVGVDLEMEIKEHYMEAVDLIDGLFKHIFEYLEAHAQQESATIRSQFKAPPVVYLPETLKLTFADAMDLLRDSGRDLEIPEDFSSFDLSTELEKALGSIVKEKFCTDYFILLKYPAAVRPFYSMPCLEDPRFANAFDVFLRGEEIASGAQRIHDAALLRSRCQALGIPIQQLKSYLEAMELGAPPHAGMGAGLERIVMLYYGLGNIRRVSLFPRDPKRLSP